MANNSAIVREFKGWVNAHIQGEEMKLSSPVTIHLSEERWGEGATVEIASVWKRPTNGALYLCSAFNQLFSISLDMAVHNELNSIVVAITKQV